MTASARVALVTGAGRGIGRATAVEFARRGLRVMATARTRSDLESLVEEIGADGEVLFVEGALDSEAGCKAVVEDTVERLGPIDVLVNSAGIGAAHEPPIGEHDFETWRRTIALNLDASFLLARAVVPSMTERGWGRIVMVSSTLGQLGNPAAAAYCASKHGVIGLVRSVALDVAAHGVTCNAVLPGWVRTSMSERSAASEAERRGMTVEEVWHERTALYAAGRLVTPEEVASVIAYLSGDSASGVNGEAIKVALGANE